MSKRRQGREWDNDQHLEALERRRIKEFEKVKYADRKDEEESTANDFGQDLEEYVKETAKEIRRKYRNR